MHTHRNNGNGAASAPETEEQGRNRHTSSSGKRAAVLCVAAAFVALGIIAVAELIARTNNELTRPAFNVLAGIFTVLAFAAGGYAQTLQQRRWSRRVKRRLLVGFPVALLSALMVIDNFYDTYDIPEGPEIERPASQPDAATRPAEDDSPKSGWYGELQHNGLMLTVSSFDDNAIETRQFCRRLLKPISYATLSLVNLGSPVPVILQSLEVRLRMDSGEEVSSLPVRALLEQKAGANTELLRRLTVPYTLETGAMLADMPICQETNFPWARMTAVTVSLSSQTLTVPGRLMTAEEKQAMFASTAAKRLPSGTNGTAEAWFKTL